MKQIVRFTVAITILGNNTVKKKKECLILTCFVTEILSVAHCTENADPDMIASYAVMIHLHVSSF